MRIEQKSGSGNVTHERAVPDPSEYFVYWIHMEHECDPFVSGYIGVTNDIQRRWRRHRRHAKARPLKKNNFHLYKAFRLYGLSEFRFEILAGPIDKTSAHHLEYALRPHGRIGHNLQIGGYWASCRSCCSLSPLRLTPTGAAKIGAHAQEVMNYPQSTEIQAEDSYLLLEDDE